MELNPEYDEPCYTITVVAKLANLHPQTLRRYEELGLVKPTRASGRRLYSQRDLDRLRKIASLRDDLGVNLAGVEVILRMSERMERMRIEFEAEHTMPWIERLRRELKRKGG